MKKALRMLKEAETPFKPASPEEVEKRNPPPAPRTASVEVQEAMRHVVDYLWADEEKGWEEDGHELGDPISADHILYYLNIMRKFIEGEQV